MEEKKILSLDGGGIKGIIQLYVLAEIEDRVGQPIYELFNFFSGPSIGGIVALFFASGLYTAN